MAEATFNKYLKDTKLSRRKFLRTLIGGTAAVAIPTAAYGHYVEMDDLEVVRKTIPLSTFPRDIPALKIGFISDFHCDGEHALHRIQHSVALLKAERPDVVFLGGDYVTHDFKHWAAPCIEALKALDSAPMGVYAILGNHDWWSCGANEVARQIRRAGFEYLDNRAVPLSKSGSLVLVGLNDVLAGRDNLSAAMNYPQHPDSCKILLVHEPDYADFTPDIFALQLSGHSHGGQVRLFGKAIITPGMGRKYTEGLEMSVNHPVYTTRGIGVVGPRLRLACRPEVTVLTLTRDETT